MYSKKILSDNWLKQNKMYYQTTNIKTMVQRKVFFQLCHFPIATVVNYNKFDGLKPQRFNLSQSLSPKM